MEGGFFQGSLFDRRYGKRYIESISKRLAAGDVRPRAGEKKWQPKKYSGRRIPFRKPARDAGYIRGGAETNAIGLMRTADTVIYANLIIESG